ncbi:unnamed protein product, partial [Amoebophrya sp. A120]|eukprot:GSA120T00014520001.1
MLTGRTTLSSFRLLGRPTEDSSRRGVAKSPSCTSRFISAPPRLRLVRKGSRYFCQLCCWLCSSTFHPGGFSFAAHVVKRGTEDHEVDTGKNPGVEPEHGVVSSFVHESYFVPPGSEREAANSGGASCGEGGCGGGPAETTEDDQMGGGAGTGIAPGLLTASKSALSPPDIPHMEKLYPLGKVDDIMRGVDVDRGIFMGYVEPGDAHKDLTCTPRELVYEKTETHRCHGSTMKFRRKPNKEECGPKQDCDGPGEWGKELKVIFFVRPGAERTAEADFLYKKTDLGWDETDTKADIEYKCDDYNPGLEGEDGKYYGKPTLNFFECRFPRKPDDEMCYDAHDWFNADHETQARDNFFAGSDNDYLRIVWL